MPKKKKLSQRVLEEQFHNDFGDFVYGNMKKGVAGEFVIMELELMKLNIWSHLFEQSYQKVMQEMMEFKPENKGDSPGYE
ncbi:hypothetical protein KKE60_05490 [Patescibacteria group bacterium]|nr:hypothetical protein [Patescibacteria group bacterium]